MNTTTQPTRIYTNDLERERLRQNGYASTDARLSLNRHRIRRAGERQLLVIGLIARENGDSTVLKDVREALNLPKGTKLDEMVEIVESRRPSKARRFGFASNRVARIERDGVTPAPSFPMSDVKAKAATDEVRPALRLV